MTSRILVMTKNLGFYIHFLCHHDVTAVVFIPILEDEHDSCVEVACP